MTTMDDVMMRLV